MTTTMNPSPDDIIAHDQRFDGAECVNDVILQVARSQRGNVKRMSQDTDIPYQTIQSWFEKEEDGSYRRAPCDRLLRLMATNDDILAGVLALVEKKRAACQNRK